MDDIRERLRRLYAAVDDTTERDLSRVPGVVSGTKEATFFVQDFSGGLTSEKMSNLAHCAISLIAHLSDHLQRLARELGHNPAEIDGLIGSCPAVAILIDLANREKHGAPRDGGRSGRAPELRNLTRQLRLSGGRTPGGGVQVQFTPAGSQVRGSGSAAAILTADVIASDGTSLGDLHAILVDALQAWEKLVHDWLPPNGQSA
jgi:hypothetical protein